MSFWTRLLRTIRRRRALLLLLLLPALVLSSFGLFASEALQALQADPMADVEVSSGDEVRRTEDDDGTALGKPTFAKILRTFSPVGGYSNQDVLDELIEAARQNGWEMESEDGYHRGFKQSGEADLVLSININSDETGVFLSLRHA